MVDDRPEDTGSLPDAGRPKREPPTIDLEATEVSSETKSETNGRRSWLERGAACLRSSSFLFLRIVSQFAASTCVAGIHASLGNLHHEHSHSAGGTRSERIFAMLRSLHQHEQRAATL